MAAVHDNFSDLERLFCLLHPSSYPTYSPQKNTRTPLLSLRRGPPARGPRAVGIPGDPPGLQPGALQPALPAAREKRCQAHLRRTGRHAHSVFASRTGHSQREIHAGEAPERAPGDDVRAGVFEPGEGPRGGWCHFVMNAGTRVLSVFVDARSQAPIWYRAAWWSLSNIVGLGWRSGKGACQGCDPVFSAGRIEGSGLAECSRLQGIASKQATLCLFLNPSPVLGTWHYVSGGIQAGFHVKDRKAA